MRFALAIPIGLTAVLAAMAGAQTPTAIDGSDVVLDAADSTSPAVASNANGQFVAVWLDSGVKAQRRNADGSSAGAVLSVGAGLDPAVAVADSGAFLVVWRVNEAGTWKVKKRFYSASDVPTAAADVDADADPTLMGDVAADAAGNFVVTWSEDVTGSYDYDVKARRYLATGEPAATEQPVSSGTASDRAPRIASSAGADGYVVVWDREVAGNYDVRARLLDATAIGISADFVVNTYTTSVQSRADVGRSREGSFVVTWDGAGSGDTTGIFGQLFDAAGAAVGGEFAVNSFTTGSQQRPRVVMDPSSNFIVTWGSTGSPGNDNSLQSVQGRAYFADGSSLGSQFQVNSYTTQTQNVSDIALLGGGEFVIAWQNHVYVMPTNFDDVRMRRFSSELPIFADGFASANTDAWSATTP